MQFTGPNLVLVYWALQMAQSDAQNQIATCPDVNEYAEDINELKKLKRKYQALAERVESSLKRSGYFEGEDDDLT